MPRLFVTAAAGLCAFAGTAFGPALAAGKNLRHGIAIAQ